MADGIAQAGHAAGAAFTQPQMTMHSGLLWTSSTRIIVNEGVSMAHRRFSAREDANGMWTVFDGPVPASFRFYEDLQRIPEERAMFLVDLLNTLELRRTARQAALVPRTETVH